VHTLLRLTPGIFYADGTHERTETDRFRAFSHDVVVAAATSQDPRANEAVGPKQRGVTGPPAGSMGCARAKKRPAVAFRRRSIV
jgi:hypothetical protein